MLQVFHLRLSVKQSATDPAGGAEVISIEEKKKVVVREPSEQEEQLGLEEEEMVGSEVSCLKIEGSRRRWWNWKW